MERPALKTVKEWGGYLVPLIAFLVYADSLGNGFTLDDHAVIVNNPLFRSGDILSLFSTIDTIGEGQLLPLYRPVTYLTFLLEWKLHHFNPFLIRLANVTLHALNSLLVYRLSRSITGEGSWLPLVAAFLCAVHPINTEGVDFNAGGRNTILATLFSLSAWLLHRRGVQRDSILPGIGSGLLFLLGLFSKESALMIAPFILWQEIETVRENRGKITRSLIRLIPHLAAAGVYLTLRWVTLARYGIQSSIIPDSSSTLLETLYVVDPLGTRLLHNLYIIPRYLWSILWPASLAPRHVIPEDLNLIALPLFLTWGVIAGGIAWLLTKGRNAVTLFGLSWCFLFWLPTSGLFIIPIQIAERYLYAPAIGLWVIIGHLVDRTVRRFPARTLTILSVTGLIILLLAAVTVRRNLDWKSNLTLYTRFARQFPDNIHALAGLGVAYYDENTPGSRQIAATIFEQVLRIDPFHPRINRLLGNIRLDEGNLADALQLYDRALESMPTDKEAMINRGITLDKLGRTTEALDQYRRFLTLPGETDHLPGGVEHARRRVMELAPRPSR